MTCTYVEKQECIVPFGWKTWKRRPLGKCRPRLEDNRDDGLKGTERDAVGCLFQDRKNGGSCEQWFTKSGKFLLCCMKVFIYSVRRSVIQTILVFC